GCETCCRCCWELKDRTNTSKPYVRPVRRQEERSLQILQPELLVRTGHVGQGQARLSYQIPLRSQAKWDQRFDVEALSGIVVGTNTESGGRFNRHLNEILKWVVRALGQVLRRLLRLGQCCKEQAQKRQECLLSNPAPGRQAPLLYINDQTAVG